MAKAKSQLPETDPVTTDEAPLYDPDAKTENGTAKIVPSVGNSELRIGDPLVPLQSAQSIHEKGAEAATPTERERYLADVARIRASRHNFGITTQKLALPDRPNYKRHWFNDTPGRIEMVQMNGWAHVLDKDSKPISRIVGSGHDKGALRAFAMEIPIEIWAEDKKAEHALAQSKMDQIKNRPIQAKPGTADKSDKDKFYSPSEEGIVQISESVGRG